jgi:hypothetical protein
VTYVLQNGDALVTFSAVGSFIADPATMPLDGDTVRIDTATRELLSLDLSAAGPVTLVLNDPFKTASGIDTVTLESLSITANDPGLLTLLAVGPPDFYFYAMEPVEVSFLATLNGVGGSTTVAGSTTATGTLLVDEAGGQLAIGGIANGLVGDGADLDDLVLKLDFSLVASAQPIPEPSAALVFGLGTVVIGVSCRRRGSSKITFKKGEAN